MNPVSTRLELACLGLAGTFWLGESITIIAAPIAAHVESTALGAFLASSDSEDADVECFVSDTDTPVDVPGCKSHLQNFQRERESHFL